MRPANILGRKAAAIPDLYGSRDLVGAASRLHWEFIAMRRQIIKTGGVISHPHGCISSGAKSSGGDPGTGGRGGDHGNLSHTGLRRPGDGWVKRWWRSWSHGN